MSVTYQEYAGLTSGSRIVWVSDNGPEEGVVKWIGVLPETRDEVIVGVEFKNPVGTGTGKYRKKRLFRARRGHASLIPILGVMKYEDFYGTQPDYGEHKNFTDSTVRYSPQSAQIGIPGSSLGTQPRVQTLADQVRIQRQQTIELQQQLHRVGQQGPPTSRLPTAPPLHLLEDLPPSYEQCMSMANSENKIPK